MVPVPRLTLGVRYRVFPVVLDPTGSGTLNVPDVAVRGVVDLAPGATSSLPVSLTLQ